jgi:hypothetical protein
MNNRWVYLDCKTHARNFTYPKHFRLILACIGESRTEPEHWCKEGVIEADARLLPGGLAFFPPGSLLLGIR